MKRFLAFIGLGLGLSTGSYIVYGFIVNESVRLVVVALGAVALTAGLILTTAWIVSNSWSRAVGSRRDQYQYRYDQRPQFQAGYQPALPVGPVGNGFDYQNIQFIDGTNLEKEEVIG